MRRPWMTLAFALTLGTPFVAAANDTASGDSNMNRFGDAQQQPPQFQQQQPGIKKHLGEVDLYVKDALNNARLLYQASDQSQSGTIDPMITREQVANIDRSLANADKHLQQLRSMPSRSFNLSKIEMLSRDLSQARTQLGTIRGGVNNDTSRLHDTSMQLAQTLQRADDDFGQIASSIGLVRVDQIHVTVKQPVRGLDEDRPFDMTSPQLRGPDIDFNSPPPNSDRAIPSPGSTAPGSSPRY
jgi:hypothetical protein